MGLRQCCSGKTQRESSKLLASTKLITLGHRQRGAPSGYAAPWSLPALLQLWFQPVGPTVPAPPSPTSYFLNVLHTPGKSPYLGWMEQVKKFPRSKSLCCSKKILHGCIYPIVSTMAQNSFKEQQAPLLHDSFSSSTGNLLPATWQEEKQPTKCRQSPK